MLRAWLLEVGVQLVNQIPVVVLDDAPLYLQRVSQFPAREGEVFLDQCESFRLFILRERSGEAFDLAWEEVAHPWIRERLRGRSKILVLPSSFTLDSRKIGNDQHRNEFALVADYDRVGYERRLLQQIFDRRRRHELSGCSLQQFFFAIGDNQVSVLIQTADISGRKPSVGA